jgi:hypothetical protein
MEEFVLLLTLTRRRILIVNASRVLASLEQNVTVSNIHFYLSVMH